MIAESDLKAIQEWAKRYNVHSVYLFGSSLEESRESFDIDLGVEGIPMERFFELTAKLEWDLSKPLDLVVLDSDNPFASVVRKYGKCVYGQERSIF